MDSILVGQKIKEKLNNQSQHAEESIHSRMESLQAELIMDILSRIPTLDLPKLSYVCKRWNNILKDPVFHRLHHTQSMSKPNENHVLVLQRSSELYFVDLSDKTNPRQIAIDLPGVPDLQSFYYVNSCNGLLCLASKSTVWCTFFIINPITWQHVLFSMPLDVDRDWVFSWGFGFDEVTKLFKVVTVVQDKNNPDNSEVRVCDLGRDGSTSWRNIGKTTLLYDPAVFFNGRLHWRPFYPNDSRGIISFDLTNEEFNSIPIPDSVCLNSIYKFDLMVLEGCLCIFHCQNHETLNLQIWIMKYYGTKASWVKKYDAQPLIPRSLNSHLSIDHGGNALKVLGPLKNGELLVTICSVVSDEAVFFISSDSTWDEFKHLRLERPSSFYGLIIHVASLNWI